jgi:lysophospholipase L1-like esterase
MAHGASRRGRRAIIIEVALALAALVAAAGRADDVADPFAKWEPAIQAFEQQDRAQPPTPGGVLFVGSSSIRLWDVQASFPDLRVVKRGFGGSEFADCAHFADRIVVPHRPRVIVLYSGDNDLARGKSPCQVYEEFLAFVERVHSALPETRIVVISIKPSPQRWSLVHRARAVNALISAACEEDPRLTLADVATPMLGADGQPRAELYVQDQLHLSATGYALWTEVVGAHVRKEPVAERK